MEEELSLRRPTGFILLARPAPPANLTLVAVVMADGRTAVRCTARANIVVS